MRTVQATSDVSHPAVHFCESSEMWYCVSPRVVAWMLPAVDRPPPWRGYRLPVAELAKSIPTAKQHGFSSSMPASTWTWNPFVGR